MKEKLKKFWNFLRSDSWASFFVVLVLAFILIKYVLFPTLSFLTGAPLPLVIVESCSMYHSDNWEEIFGSADVCYNGETELSLIGGSFEILEGGFVEGIEGVGFVEDSVPSFREIDSSEAEIGDYVVYILESGVQYRQEIVRIEKDKYFTEGEVPCQGGGIYSNYGIGIEDAKDWPFQNGLNKGDIIFVLGVESSKLEIGDVLIFQSSESLPYPIIHRIIDINSDGSATTKGDNNVGLLQQEKRISEERFMGRALFRVPYAGWIKLIFFDWRKPASLRGLCS